MSDPFRVLRPVPMEGKGVYNRGSQVQAAASGLSLPFDTPVTSGTPKSSAARLPQAHPPSAVTEMRVPLTSVANDVYRNGALIATVSNTGAHSDSTGSHGRASFTYRVCEAGTATCSKDATVRFGR